MEQIGLKKQEVKLFPYDPAWAELYKKEEKLFRPALGKIALEIQHIGSTSIPGTMAKPIIDIAVGVKDLKDAEDCIEPLKKLSYKLKHNAEDGRYFFTKENNGKITHHLHIVKFNGELWKNQIIFRDYLKKYKGAVNKYNELKNKLAKKYENDRKNMLPEKIILLKI